MSKLRFHLPTLPSVSPWGLALVLAVACSGDDEGTNPTDGPSADTGSVGDDDDDDTQPLSVDATAQVSPHVPSVMHLTGTVPEGAPSGSALVATATPSDRSLPSWTVEAPAVAGEAFLLPLTSLVQSQAYEVAISLTDGTGAELASDALSLTAPVAPGAVGFIQGVNTSEAIEPGFLGMSLIGSDDTSYMVVVDDQARVVWWKPAEPNQIIITPVLGRDGVSFAWGEYDVTKLRDTGTWHQVRFDGTGATTRRIELSHHAAVELPNGDVSWLAFDFRDVVTSDGSTRRMATDTLLTGPSTYEPSPTELFNTFDDHPGPPTLTCEHIEPGRFDRFDERGITEWTHGNSLAYVDSEDAYYLNAKQTDWVLKISGSGELLWQLGGLGGDFTYSNGDPVWTGAYDPTLFSHAHMSHVWEGGMVTFDNGDHRTPKVSSVAELAWDEQERTVERVWEFFHPGRGHTFPLGDVKKLGDGSYLVSWGALSEFMVVDADQSVRWHATVPDLFTLGRIVPVESL